MAAVALLIVMGLLGVGGIVAWILAVRLSYRVERQRDPGLPPQRLMMTNLFRSAFFSPANDPADPALRARMRGYIYLALACIIAMGAASFVLPVLASSEPAAAAAATTPPQRPDPTGTTLSYIRSNQDGSLPERVLVRVVSPTEIHVAKMVAPCTDAAYVTATFDPATREATRLVGGRLTRAGEQDPQVFLTLAPGARKLELRSGDPASDPVETHDAPAAPWRMYDFDLAEFALFGPMQPEDFTFGLAMASTDGAAPMVRTLGLARADFLYSSQGSRNHFRVLGPAFTDPLVGDRGGELILDSRTGHVMEARFGRPNHAGYTNFMLRLLESTPGPEGETTWRNALAQHWANCPPAE